MLSVAQLFKFKVLRLMRNLYAFEGKRMPAPSPTGACDTALLVALCALAGGGYLWIYAPVPSPPSSPPPPLSPPSIPLLQYGLHGVDPACCVAEVQTDEGLVFPSPETFYRDYVLENRPLIFRGGARSQTAFRRWADDAYVVASGNAGGAGREARVEMAEEFKVGASGTWREDFASFFRSYTSPAYDGYMFTPLPNAMRKDLAVPPFMHSAPFVGAVIELNMWVSGGGTVGHMHFDQYDNLNCQMDGRKEIILVAPANARAVLGDEIPRVSFDADNFDARNLTTAAQAPFYKVMLERGDCLFLPTLWLHQIRSPRDARNFNVNVWFSLWSQKRGLKGVPRQVGNGVAGATFHDPFVSAAQTQAFKQGRGPHPFDVLRKDFARVLRESKEVLSNGSSTFPFPTNRGDPLVDELPETFFDTTGRE